MAAAPETPHPPAASQSGILAVVLIYAVFAALWILLSDKVVQLMFSEPAQITLASMFKGWLFVGVTALLLYGLMKRILAGEDSGLQHLGSIKHLGLPFVLLAAIILILMGAAAAYSLIHHKETEVARLQDIADLKTRQIADWLRERSGDTAFLQSSQYFAGQYRNWQVARDAEAGRALQSRLLEFCRYQACAAVSLFDPVGNRLWGSDAAPRGASAELQAAVHRAAASRAAVRAGPYRGLHGHTRLDFAVPLTALSGPAPVVVLHVDTGAWLFPTTQNWPTPSASGETLLFRRDGNQVVFLNDLRLHPGAAARLRVPLASGGLIFGRVLQNRGALGKPAEGMDYRDVAVIGVTRPVAGTDWLLMAKLDQSELYGDAVGDLAWIGFSGLLAILISAAGLFVLRQHQQLALAQSVQAEQARRLDAQRLLGTIADSSTDAIFAKDLDGRYLLFNREAERLTGKPAQAVLGHDDTDLFPPEQASQIRHNDEEVIASAHTASYQEELVTTDGRLTFLATKGPLLDAGGKTIGMFGISRNITQIRRALDALAVERDRNQRYLDTVQTMLVAMDTQGSITMINRAGCAMLGYSEQELLGRNWFDTCLPQPEGMDEVYPVFRQIMQGNLQPTEYFENTVRCRDGGLRLIAWHNAPLNDESGQVVGVLSSGQDITEQKQAETALRTGEAFKRAILDSVSAQIAVLDARGVIVAVNQPWQRFAEDNADASGPPRHTGVGVNYLDICRQSVGPHSEGAQAAADGIERVLAGQQPRFSLEYPCHSPDVRRWFNMTVTPLGIPGQGVVIAHTDITARKSAEETLNRQAGELLQRNEELERFNRAVVGRELDMIALKQAVNALSIQLGLAPPHPLGFLQSPDDPPDRDEAK